MYVCTSKYMYGTCMYAHLNIFTNVSNRTRDVSGVLLLFRAYLPFIMSYIGGYVVYTNRL